MINQIINNKKNNMTTPDKKPVLEQIVNRDIIPVNTTPTPADSLVEELDLSWFIHRLLPAPAPEKDKNQKQ